MLARLVPGSLVRWFARPYVAGESIDAGLDVAERELTRGVTTTLDLLGEDVTRPDQVARNVGAYTTLLDRLGTDPRFADAATRPTVSLKPSAFTTGPREDVRAPIRALVEQARVRNVAVTIDMEDRRWTDLTLELSTGLFREGFDVGTVLQTRLHRTEKDLAAIPEGMRLRLVIGIYPEPEDIALTDKRPMKERMVAYAAQLLDRGVHVEFATHDEEFVERFAREVAPRAPERCEVQLLLGVPRRPLVTRLLAGELGPARKVRLYVPFALGWDDATAYLRRRMAESPNLVWLVLRNVMRGRGAR